MSASRSIDIRRRTNASGKSQKKTRPDAGGGGDRVWERRPAVVGEHERDERDEAELGGEHRDPRRHRQAASCVRGRARCESRGELVEGRPEAAAEVDRLEPAQPHGQGIAAPPGDHDARAPVERAQPLGRHVRRVAAVARRDDHDARRRVERRDDLLAPVAPGHEVVHVEPDRHAAPGELVRERLGEVVVAARVADEDRRGRPDLRVGLCRSGRLRIHGERESRAPACALSASTVRSGPVRSRHVPRSSRWSEVPRPAGPHPPPSKATLPLRRRERQMSFATTS